MSATAEEVWRILREVAQSQKETDLKFKETDLKFKETAQEIQTMSREIQAMSQEIQVMSREVKTTAREIKEAEYQIKELGKQIGGLGKKFGSFTEGLALPSMEKILQQRFGMEVISPSVRASKNGKHMEIDVLAYANSSINQAYLVEVKSHVREESIMQIKTLLERFRSFFPEHKDKTVYGILAAVDITSTLKERVLGEGIYLARIHDEVFTMETPEAFQAKAY